MYSLEIRYLWNKINILLSVDALHKLYFFCMLFITIFLPILFDGIRPWFCRMLLICLLFLDISVLESSCVFASNWGQINHLNKTHTQTAIQTHTNTDIIQSEAHIQTPIQTQTPMQTPVQTPLQTPMHQFRHQYRSIHSPIQAQIQIPIHTNTDTNTHTLTNTDTNRLKQTHTDSHKHTYLIHTDTTSLL